MATSDDTPQTEPSSPFPIYIGGFDCRGWEFVLPDDPLSREVEDFVEKSFGNPAGVAQTIINHGKRVYFYATSLSISAGSPRFEMDLEPYRFAACMLHNLGLIASLDNVPFPYEVCSADGAVILLTAFNRLPFPSYHVPPLIIDAVHQAITLHTSAAPAVPSSHLADHLRMAIMADADPSLVSHASARRVLEAAYPRMGIEYILRSMIINQVLRKPEKAPEGSRARELIKAGRAGHGFW